MLLRNPNNRYILLATLAILGAMSLGPFAGDAFAVEDATLRAAVSLKTPRKEPPRQGGPLDKVELAIWLPGDAKTIRGVVCNPFYIETVGQKHWQEACRLWGFALVGGNYFGVKQDEFATTLQAALDDFAQQSGRAEIAHLPFCFVGMSAGGGMSMKFAEQMPSRTIAVAPVCLEVGPTSSATRAIPVVTIFGQKDGKQMQLLTEKLPIQRADGAQWAIAVQWGQRHDFARANNLVMPLFADAIRLRLPQEQPAAGSPAVLKTLDAQSGWLGQIANWEESLPAISPAKENPSSAASSCWFPTEDVAQIWQAFVSRSKKIKIASPAGMGDGQPLEVFKPNEPIQVQIALGMKEPPSKVALYAGAKLLAETSAEPYEFSIKLPSGVHSLSATASWGAGSPAERSPPNTIIVRFE